MLKPMWLKASVFVTSVAVIATQSVGNATTNGRYDGNLQNSGGIQFSRVCTLQMQNQIRDVCARQLSGYGVFSRRASTSGQISPDSMTWDRLRRQTKDLFVEICRGFEDWDRCVAPYKMPCWKTEPIKGEFTVAHEALAYVCRPPAYGDMLQNWNCLLRSSQRSALILCDAQILQDARMGMYADLRQGRTACAVLQDYVGCISEPIRQQCGNKAWGHVREAFQRPTNVYLPYCTLGTAGIRPIFWYIGTIYMLLIYWNGVFQY